MKCHVVNILRLVWKSLPHVLKLRLTWYEEGLKLKNREDHVIYSVVKKYIYALTFTDILYKAGDNNVFAIFKTDICLTIYRAQRLYVNIRLYSFV